MTRYLAFIRGINVGGHGIVAMSALKVVLEKAGLSEVKTYIQSGNVFFSSAKTDSDELAEIVHAVILESFSIDAGVVVFHESAWEKVIKNAPVWWGNDATMKHNILILLRPYNMREVTQAIGDLKPGIEHMEPGDGVLYQSMSIKLFGRTTTGKLAKSPIYKQMTVRNYNTATKLLGLF